MIFTISEIKKLSENKESGAPTDGHKDELPCVPGTDLATSEARVHKGSSTGLKGQARGSSCDL